jgi:hypothetical protein
VDKECENVAVEGFQINAGIPVGMSKLFGKSYIVTVLRYLPQESLISGYQ